MGTRKPLILMVDDESHILHVLSMKLRTTGYDVITAEDGEEGLLLAMQHRPDLVITDYQMPYMTGLQLCQELAQRESTRDIIVLMLTARGPQWGSQCLTQPNLAGVITKPFSPREVVGRVRELVGRPVQRKVG